MCNALSKSMRPSKGEKKRDPNRMDACYFVVGEESCLDPPPPCAVHAVLLPLAECVHCEEVGKMAVLVCGRPSRTLADRNDDVA